MARSPEAQKRIDEQMKLINAQSKSMRQKPAPAPAPAPAPKPTMAQNYKTLGKGMAAGAKRMVEQRKIIADNPPKKAK
jgi:hypothetical protein